MITSLPESGFGKRSHASVGNWSRTPLAAWDLAGSECVVHLDFHTGLGRRGAYKLLLDYPLNERQRRWLTDWIGADSFASSDSGGVAYDARGGFGRWCMSRDLAPEYLFAYAEFGTYGPVSVLAGLRAENQAHHWGAASVASTVRAKQRLKELFCPSAAAWRSEVIERSVDLVNRVQRGLLSPDAVRQGRDQEANLRFGKDDPDPH